MRSDGKKLLDAECRQLESLLDDEHRGYRRLLRLARRQNSYMKRQDVDRLGANSQEWSRHLPAANAARLAREHRVRQLGGGIGVEVPPGRISDLLDYADPTARSRILALLGEMRRTAGALARQNELNRQLAEFCLDLVGEEAQIFKNCVLRNPSGCYGSDAKTSERGPGGVMVRQA